MDRSMELRHLAQAERHVKIGKKHIADQEKRVAMQQLYGRDATAFEELLETFRRMQDQHVAHRDRILAKLGRSGGRDSMGKEKRSLASRSAHRNAN
jgi:hypothetical protein